MTPVVVLPSGMPKSLIPLVVLAEVPAQLMAGMPDVQNYAKPIMMAASWPEKKQYVAPNRPRKQDRN
jgi:hypothetical protein